ncbi:MAG: S-layer homology domain-containing protein [Monoglobales bacterium]
MMKRLMSIVLAALMLTTMSFSAFAIPPADLPALLADNSIETTRNLDVPVDIKIDANGSGTYVDGPINKDYDSGGIAVGYKATIFMNDVRAAYNAYLSAANFLVAGIPSLETELANCRITGTFTIKVSYPDSAVIPTDMLTGTALYGFNAEAENAFEETTPRTVSLSSQNGMKDLTITLSLKTPYITVSDMTANLNSYLPDISLIVNNVVLNKIGDNKVTGTLTGQTLIKDTQDRLVGTINYIGKQGNASGVTGSEISETVKIASPGGIVVTPPSGGGGGTTGPVVQPPETKIDVESNEPKVEVGQSQISNVDKVVTTTKTESGTQVSATINVKSGNIGSLLISTNDTNITPIGSAATSAVAPPIQINATAKDTSGNDIDRVILSNVSIVSQVQSYVYILDDYGVPVRTDSVFNPSTGLVTIPEVPSGATIILSSQKPLSFIDTVDHWSERHVNYVADVGLIRGKSEVIYDPEASLTRAEQASLLLRISELASLEINKPTDDLRIDTDPSHWANEELRTALANNWLVGTGINDGVVAIAADVNISREQFVTTIWRLLGEPDVEDVDMSRFIDADSISDWAFQAMSWAVANGIINGVPVGNNQYLTNANVEITRAESAKVYSELVKVILQKVGN